MKLKKRIMEKKEEWLALPPSKVQDYYQEEVFPLVKELFLEKYQRTVKKMSIYGLILTVGTSPERPILSLSLCSPERVLFLYTEETEGYLTRIARGANLDLVKCEKRLVHKNDPLNIYQEVFAVWERWGKRENIAADMTGGTKSMTGGLAMAASLIGAQLLYVSSNSLFKLNGQLDPGTEVIEFLPNPFSVFGVLKKREAQKLYRRHDFHGARLAYKELKDRLPELEVEFSYYLTYAYECWASLHLEGAVKNLRRCYSLKYRMNRGLEDPVGKLLLKQAKSLEKLYRVIPKKPEEPTLPLLKDKESLCTLMASLYLSAQRKAEQGKWDTASLLLYRLLEIFSQKRLASYGVDTADVDYELLPSDLLQKVNAIRVNSKMSPYTELPNPVSLTEGYLILQALNDPFSPSATEKKVSINKLVYKASQRNYSILAHGYIFISQEHYCSFKEMVDQFFQLFCEVERIHKDEILYKNRFLGDLLSM